MSLDDLVAKTHNSEVWVVEFTDEFEAWWEPLDVEQQAALGVRIGLLGSQGPDLGVRGHVKVLAGGQEKSSRW